MKKKFLLVVLAIAGIGGVVTAQQKNEAQTLAYDCNCCEGSQNSTCYVVQDDIVISCGKGLNICDMEPIE